MAVYYNQFLNIIKSRLAYKVHKYINTHATLKNKLAGKKRMHMVVIEEVFKTPFFNPKIS